MGKGGDELSRGGCDWSYSVNLFEDFTRYRFIPAIYAAGTVVGALPQCQPAVSCKPITMRCLARLGG